MQYGPQDRSLPDFLTLLDDQPLHERAAVAGYLGVNESTLAGWVEAECAPRMARLALYYQTRWGRSDVACRAESTASLYYWLATALQNEKARMRGLFERPTGQIVSNDAVWQAQLMLFS